MATTVLIIILVLTLSHTAIPKAEAAVSCGQVVNSLAPCMSYVMKGGNTVPAPCCNGVRNLNNIARTTPDRQAVCSCIKSVTSSSRVRYSKFNLNLAAGLPKKCGVNLPYQISPNIDCARVH